MWNSSSILWVLVILFAISWYRISQKVTNPATASTTATTAPVKPTATSTTATPAPVKPTATSTTATPAPAPAPDATARHDLHLSDVTGYICAIS